MASLKSKSVFSTIALLHFCISHALNNCTSFLNNGQLKPHHDSILKTILFYLTSANKYDVFADVEGYYSAVLFNLSVRYIFFIKDNILYTIELTVCFERSFSKGRNYKINRYKNLSNNYAIMKKKLFQEILSLGFYTNDAKP